MSSSPSESPWSIQWSQYLADQEHCAKRDESLVLTDPTDERQSADPSKRYLASGHSGLQDSLRKNLRNSIRYNGADHASRASRHLVGASLSPLPGTAGIQVGEIIQLDPALCPEWDRAVYVLILSVDEREAEVAPFGPIRVPANEGELLTGLGESGLDVLCAWNASRIAASHLGRHFKIATVEGNLLEETRALLCAIRSGGVVPPELLPRVGPSPYRFSAAKQEYLDREESLLFSLIPS